MSMHNTFFRTWQVVSHPFFLVEADKRLLSLVWITCFYYALVFVWWIFGFCERRPIFWLLLHLEYQHMPFFFILPLYCLWRPVWLLRCKSWCFHFLFFRCGVKPWFFFLFYSGRVDTLIFFLDLLEPISLVLDLSTKIVIFILYLLLWRFDRIKMGFVCVCVTNLCRVVYVW